MFTFSSEQDKSRYMSLKGLVNKRNGLFYSVKQSKFFNREFNDVYATFDEHKESRKKYMGVDIFDGEIDHAVDATASWAHGRGQMPVSWFFITDKFGVVRIYRLKYRGNLRDGASPVPEKTKIEWERPANLDTSALEAEFAKLEAAKVEQQKVDSKSQYVGKVGERINTTVSLRRAVGRCGDWGSYDMLVMEDSDGNLFFANVGDATDKFVDGGAKIRGTVKGHFNTKDGAKATRLSRLHFVKEKK